MASLPVLVQPGKAAQFYHESRQESVRVGTIRDARARREAHHRADKVVIDSVKVYFSSGTNIVKGAAVGSFWVVLFGVLLIWFGGAMTGYMKDLYEDRNAGRQGFIDRGKYFFKRLTLQTLLEIGIYSALFVPWLVVGRFVLVRIYHMHLSAPVDGLVVIVTTAQYIFAAYCAVGMLLWTPALVNDDIRVIEGFKKGFSAIKGRFWNIALFMIAVGIVSIITSAIVTRVFNLVTITMPANTFLTMSSFFVERLIQAAFRIIFAAFTIAGYLRFYRDAKNEREGAGLSGNETAVV
jgi:hypothetical protein